ncbi:PD-(D/E)XK motif protein [Streptomyces sp. H27-H1]|uniref:PD-(D/E)XK motif protein n=1 Tax=unclassified Streptomyces TaxID=2593676 RepID=UPI0022700E5D|nr:MULTISPECIES: PD-(D/E)XK motif protein [unclassified Streptomyces]MCY0927009.1 PD-(D/E)XK motif protein [Streptomyces sp. H27-H1]MCY0933273.1 PD-(D/E)XK motif protein [Streptomyces sp. H34-S4]
MTVTSVTEDEWRELESPQDTPGRSSIRMYPDSPLDIFLSVAHPGRQRMLVLRTDARSADPVVRSVGRLPRAAGIEMSLSAVSRLEYELQVILTEKALREVFNPLVADVAATAQAASGAADALSAAVARFGRWQDLLRVVGTDGLSVEARRGLYGELLLLGDTLIAELSQSEAVDAWTGPTGANQDFQLPDVAIETKASTSKRPRNIRIASERQLDDTGTPALLLALAQLDERRGGSGESLNRRVEHIRQQLTNSAARVRFDGLLIQAGYLPAHRDRYDEPRYTVRDLRFWHVREGFPRLTESDLPEGVGDCSYHVSTSGLDAFRAQIDEVREMIGGADG